MADDRFDTVVIGAGHNGLVAAFYLARSGHRVLVLEARDQVGGAVATEELVPGYRFSVCAHVLRYLHPSIIRDLQLAERGVRVDQLTPYRVNLYPDGSRWIQWPEFERTVEEADRFAPGSGERLRSWNRFWRDAGRLFEPYWLDAPPTEEDLRRRSAELGEPDLYDRLASDDMVSFVRRHFDDERFQGAFIGGPGDPRQPGSMLEVAWGSAPTTFDPAWVGLPRGGMGALADAMAEAAGEAGASIRTGVRVERILVDGGRAAGVETQDGEVLRSRLVVSNLGPKPTFLGLLEPGALPASFTARVADLSTRIAYLKFHVGLSEAPDLSRYFPEGDEGRAAAYVRMCPSVDVLIRAWEDAARGLPAQEPVLQLGSLTAYDPSTAPSGGHAVSALGLYAPPRPADSDWDTVRESVAQALIDQISSYIPNFRKATVAYVLFTPADLERRYGMQDGNIDHIDHSPGQFFTGRPFPGQGGWRTPLPGLYCCGAGTHPGGEVSGAPGYNAAQQILSDDRADGAVLTPRSARE